MVKSPRFLKDRRLSSLNPPKVCSGNLQVSLGIPHADVTVHVCVLREKDSLALLRLLLVALRITIKIIGSS